MPSLKNGIDVLVADSMQPQDERSADIDKIRAITDRINSHDADSIEGYLTHEESKLIQNLANKHKINADELRKIGGRTFDKNWGYNVDEYAWKEPVKPAEPTFDDKLKEFYSDEEISKLTPQDIDLIKDFLGRFNNPKRR